MGLARSRRRAVRTVGQLKQQAVWRHNGLRGSVAMAKSAMVIIAGTATATDEAQAMAMTIKNLLDHLDELMKVRRE
jgi:hypothetical protein